MDANGRIVKRIMLNDFYGIDLVAKKPYKGVEDGIQNILRTYALLPLALSIARGGLIKSLHDSTKICN